MDGSVFGNATILYVMIGFFLAWTFPWKAWALWKAARKGDLTWFLIVLFVNTFAILDILYIFIFSKEHKEKEGVTESYFSDQENQMHDFQKPKMVL